ncbi:unnamed protein product [Rodentolepis nana]|uniref:HAUS6_N domain-containing protein n=1 Tax=Rodentolepis nana TaxID=102285 RepID=A0A0R3T234_RODNA|nr:unnamed protein product [Rodentolepis nana]
MSVQESASALVNLLSLLGLPRIKVDVIRQMKLNSPNVYNESVHILWSFIILLQRNQAVHGDIDSEDMETTAMITTVNNFIISQGFPLFISSTNKNRNSLALINLLWCFHHFKIFLLPESIFSGAIFAPPGIHSPKFLRKISPAENFKQYLLNVSSITSAIRLKETELSLLFKAILNQPSKLHLKFPLHPLSSLQRSMTLLELLYVLNDNKASQNNDLSKFKRFLDTLTKWNRNSSAFYRWVRLPSGTALSDSNECVLNVNEQISRQIISKSYCLLQKQSSILRRYGSEMTTMTTDINKSNPYELQTEFKRRLDFISDCLKAHPYQIHPMENFSIASEISTVMHKFDAQTEKQVLQSLISSLKSQLAFRKSCIHSKIEKTYRDLLPNVSCFHKHNVRFCMIDMAENGTVRVQERFRAYSKPELLQLASYLAQHDVAFNNLPIYPTDKSADDDLNIQIQKDPKPIVKKEKPKNVPPKPSTRSHSPPVRDTGIDVPLGKPLYAPTERQLNATQESHLRQLISKSKAALLKLDREILAERSDLSFNKRRDLSEPSMIQRLSKRPNAPTGVLKPRVRALGDKGAPKTRRPTSGRKVTRSIKNSANLSSQHAPDPPSSHDTRILSAYLKRLALEKGSQGQENFQLTDTNQPKEPPKGSNELNAHQNYAETSNIHYKQQYPPGLLTFLEKWGSKLDKSDYKEAGRPQVHFDNDEQLDSSTASTSTSTDSISQFIRRHAKHNKQPHKLKSRSAVNKSIPVKSINASKSKNTSVERSSLKMVNELKEDETPYRILRLPVEQYQQILTMSKIGEVANAGRYNCKTLLSSHKLEKPHGIVQVSEALSEEIGSACVESVAKLFENLSNEVINELLQSELAISTSPWSSFSGISESPQQMPCPDVKQPISPISSKSKILQSSAPKNSIEKSKIPMPNQTSSKTLSPVEEWTTRTGLSIPENKSPVFVLGGSSLSRNPEVRADQKQVIVEGDGLIRGSSKEGFILERISTPEEVRLKSPNSDIIHIKSTNGDTLIKNASSGESISSLPSRVLRPREPEPGEALSLKSSSSQGDLVSIDNSNQAPTNKVHSQAGAGPNSLKSTHHPNVRIPDELSTQKALLPYDNPLSLVLLPPIERSHTPDIETIDTSIFSNGNTTQFTISSPNGSSQHSNQFYEDDFESTGEGDSN